MLSKTLALLGLFLLCLTLLGCGSSHDRGLYRDKDKPRSSSERG